MRRSDALDPDSLTVHSLAVKRAARMGQEGYIPGGEEIGDMLDLAAETAREMGMSPYYLYRQKNIAGNFENTGYAKVDKAGIYNILIMEEKQSIIAAGAGASTKIVLKEPVPSPEGRGKKTNLIRQENVKAIDAYVRRVRRDDRAKRRMAMTLKKKPVTGMKDILPEEMEIRDYVIGLIKDTYKTYGFSVYGDALRGAHRESVQQAGRRQ